MKDFGELEGEEGKNLLERQKRRNLIKFVVKGSWKEGGECEREMEKDDDNLDVYPPLQPLRFGDVCSLYSGNNQGGFLSTLG